jgi:hypothetical protein
MDKQKRNLLSHVPTETEFEKRVKLSLCLTKHYVMKVYGGSGCIGPYFLDLGTGERSVGSEGEKLISIKSTAM